MPNQANLAADYANYLIEGHTAFDDLLHLKQALLLNLADAEFDASLVAVL